LALLGGLEQRRGGVRVGEAAEALRRQRDVGQLVGGERDGGLDADLWVAVCGVGGQLVEGGGSEWFQKGQF